MIWLLMVEISPDELTMVPSKTTSEITTPAFGSVRRSGEHADEEAERCGGSGAVRETANEPELWPNATGEQAIASKESAARDRIMIHQPDLLLSDLLLNDCTPRRLEEFSDLGQ